jgi:alanine-glyoxylate transaminase / serine-glyoxylate transaminase / serine-pyruvate transaminase
VPFAPFDPPLRTLMGPGPSPVAASVLAALARPTLGHLDPRFLDLMDEVRSMLREVFETENALTIPMSGTGSAGMETVLVNLIEPGDAVLVGACGVFGTRLADIARRAGAEVIEVAGEWGRALPVDALRARAAGKRFKLLCAVHAETSTGVLQPLEPLRELADELGALLVIDAVTSLGGIPVGVDRARLDAVYSGTQKCLGCPPGLAPVTFSARAEAALAARTKPVQSFYLDLSLIRKYWGSERAYHHTAPINMLYGLHEALRLTLAEGLEPRFRRHRRNAEALWAGIEALDLGLAVPLDERLPSLTSVLVPEGIDEARLRKFLLEVFSLEIGAGLGPLRGKTWRIGLMGAGSSRQNVLLCLSALRAALADQGRRTERDPIAAADAVYERGD